MVIHCAGDIREFSAFPFSLHLMFEQTLSKLIVFDDFTNTTNIICANELTGCSGFQVGLFFSQN